MKNKEKKLTVEDMLKFNDFSVDDVEIIRQISLKTVDMKLSKEIRKQLSNKINPIYAYVGLYPEIQKSYNILPDDDKLMYNEKELLKLRKEYKKVAKDIFDKYGNEGAFKISDFIKKFVLENYINSLKE